jgi:hypothetical protein
MADRREPIRKTPADILDDLMDGHREALYGGHEAGKKYLLKFSERNVSLPNAVKFFLCDMLAEDAFKADDLKTCRAAVTQALTHIPAARADMLQQFRRYVPAIRLFERGIAMATDDGDFEAALRLCGEAIALGLGPVYAAKRASIERMM